MLDFVYTLEEDPGGLKRRVYEYFINIYFGNPETINCMTLPSTLYSIWCHSPHHLHVVPKRL